MCLFEASCFPEEPAEVIPRPLGLRWQAGLSPLSLGQLEPVEKMVVPYVFPGFDF